MRTNIDIDDDLMAEALRVSGLPTKKAVVEAGLRRLVQGNRYAQMLALHGKLRWEGDLEAMRVDSPPSPVGPAPASRPAASPAAARRADDPGLRPARRPGHSTKSGRAGR